MATPRRLWTLTRRRWIRLVQQRWVRGLTGTSRISRTKESTAHCWELSSWPAERTVNEQANTKLTHQTVQRGNALELGCLPDGEQLARPEHGREEGGDKRISYLGKPEHRGQQMPAWTFLWKKGIKLAIEFLISIFTTLTKNLKLTASQTRERHKTGICSLAA